jgi:membrane protein insertase Oxa1/YidC/SpoIIIJ
MLSRLRLITQSPSSRYSLSSLLLLHADSTPPATDVPVAPSQSTNGTSTVVHADDTYQVLKSIQDVFHHLHENLDIPWWTAIAGCAVLFKMSTVVFVPSQMRNAAKLQYIQPKVEALRKEKLMNPTDKKLSERINREIDGMYKRYDCSTLTSGALSLVQVPFMLGMFFSLNSDSLAVRYPEIKQETFFWVQDLSITDPYYALPALSSLSMLLAMEFSPDMANYGSKTKNIIRGLMLVSFPFFAQFASVCINTLCFFLIEIFLGFACVLVDE